MNSVILELLSFASVAIIAGLIWIFSIAKELAPKERKKWLLGLGLGAGVITFTLKIAFVVIFGLNSSKILALLPDKELISPAQDGSISIYIQSPVDMSPYKWEALPVISPSPSDNPPTLQKIKLGKKLFFDKRLSADNSLSCASCHELSNEKGGTDGQTTSTGIHGQKGSRNAPTVLNAAFQSVLFLDGRASSLEEQAKGPIMNPIEMGMPSVESVVKKISGIDEYVDEFKKVFNSEQAITMDNIAKAIAAYERTLITPDTAYDRFVRGDYTALTDQQKKGMSLFETVGCVVCHSGPNFSNASIFGDIISPYRFFPANEIAEYDSQYHFTDDSGKADPDTHPKKGIWKIPSLRNVGLTAPYFHNGAVDSLEEAVRIMAKAQLNRKLTNNELEDSDFQWSRKTNQYYITNNLALNDNEVKSIVAFLQSLSSDISRYQMNPDNKVAENAY